MTDTFKYIGTVYPAGQNNSRYRAHKVIEVNSVGSMETWDPPTIPLSNNDKFYRITPTIGWRLDLLADYYYGDQNLWWVIAFANGIVDPFADLNTPPDPPFFIRIPDPATVFNKLNR